MKSILTLFLLLAPVALPAQDPPKPVEEAKQTQEAKPAPETKPTEEAKPAADAPAPDLERPLSGVVDFGNRFVTGPSGHRNTYRSIVNLGEGPRVFNFDFGLQDPTGRLFDDLNVFGGNWGGDPYNTLRVIANKQRVYRFTADYRNLTYFDFLPSFANPNRPDSFGGAGANAVSRLTPEGTLLNQRSYDTHFRMSDIYLELFPTRRIVPFFSYQRNSWFGSGVTPFVAQSTEYPIRNDLQDSTDLYRGGVRLQFDRWHLTLEQGATKFRDDQRVFSTEANPGNRTVPILGQTLRLADALQSYAMRGESIFSRINFTASPYSGLNVHGQFLFSQPETDVHYSESANGNFILLNAARFYNRLSLGVNGEAARPRTSGTIGYEAHIGRRFRVIQAMVWDRLHNASDIAVTERLFFASSTEQVTNSFQADRVEWNYYRSQNDALFDVTKSFTLRGGYRYISGRARSRPGDLGSTGDVVRNLEQSKLERHVGLAGATYRPNAKFTLNAELEASNGVRTFFRTSLQDYTRLRLIGRYQLTGSLLLTGNLRFLDNQNPAPGVDYDFRSRYQTFGVYWTPKGGKVFTLLTEYARSTLRSDISYIVPQELSRARSFYRDNAHTATAVAELAIPRKFSPRLSFGGSFFLSNGSRPTSFYQPLGRFLIPLHRRLHYYTEWRWFGYDDQFYGYSGFRTHHIVTGLRLFM
ncbi:MAG: hypothetical protein SFV54_19435 [Bryobacteraceae bacterium]|nr:hypothetical protein [Bryobacteraceae bacterium]